MCEIEKQLNELLAGTKPTQTTKALKIQAMYIDKKFANIEEKLDLILDKIDENKLETDKQLSKIRAEQAQSCMKHKTDLDNRLNDLDEKTEVVGFFTKHPKILIIAGIGLVFLIGFAFGYGKIMDLLKLG